MTYRLEIRPSALKELARLPKSDQRRVADKIDSLARDPRPHGAVKLSGKLHLWRIRSGDYRAIYQIRDDRLVVLVLAVAHRRDVYRHL